MRLFFLGTNGWYDTKTGNTICVLLRTERWDIIFDAGNGLAKMDKLRSVDDKRQAFILLSHFHLDHIEGLHTLVKIPFYSGLTICGPEGTKSILGKLINQPFTIPMTDLPYPVSLMELPAEENELPFNVMALPLRHVSLTLGYRIEVEGKVVTYLPDTGYCENALRLANDADILVSECAYPSGKGNEEWPHLNPESAARIAREGNVKKLILVHFDAFQFPTLRDRKKAEMAAKKIFPNTVAAKDDWETMFS
ncbi:MAG: MBL fold metallo-hydrolase [Syntrophales bacterium]|nr:MBL fold metallo-hydrolase [Syntrophales bacterium]